MASSSVVRIELLDKENYDTWRIQMEAILTKNNAWDYVCGEIERPQIITGNAGSAEMARAWDNEDRKAKSDIILAIRPSELKQIKGCVTSREVWLKLKSIYQSSGPARKATLLKQLMLFKMDAGEDVRDNLRKFFDTVDKLNEMSIEINSDLLTVMLLYSLPPSFENFRCAIESRDELPNPEALRIKIIEEQDARRNETRGSEQNAMCANRQAVKRQGKKFGKESKGTPKGENQSKREPFKYRCHRCRKIGHKATDCGESGKNADYANVADDMCLHADVEYAHNSGEIDAQTYWCLDSGCTNHMGNNNVRFVDVIEPCNGSVRFAGEKTSTTIRRIGSVSIRAENGGRPKGVKVQGVLHVPGLSTNLLSVGKITDQGYRVTFEKEGAYVIDKDGNTMLTADRKNGLYFIRKEKGGCSARSEVANGTEAKITTKDESENQADEGVERNAFPRRGK